MQKRKIKDPLKIEDPLQYPVQVGLLVAAGVGNVYGRRRSRAFPIPANGAVDRLASERAPGRADRPRDAATAPQFTITTTITDERRGEIVQKLQQEKQEREARAAEEAAEAARQEARIASERQRAAQRMVDINAAYAAAQVKCDAKLRVIFKRATGGERFGLSEKQGWAWVLNELLDEGRCSGAIHKQEGGRIAKTNPTTFQEHVEKAHRKLRPGGNLERARDVLAQAGLHRWSNTGPLSAREYDEMIGPSNRKGGRSAELPLFEIPKRDTSRTTRGGVRTAVRKVRYGPGDRVGDD